jgi:DNA-binding CsgD family transcriptional regulator/tetratricopeptide (TPR) repeat protein
VEPLLERNGDLAALVGVVEAARRGRGALVLVGGEAGIGKTSLLRALRARVGGEVDYVVGACESLSVPVPLQPVHELASAVGAGDRAEVGVEDRLALARSLLGALAARAPVVAVVEDAHWADPATLDVLRLLARRVEDAGVVIVVTYRDDELAANPSLAVLVGDLVTNPAVRRIALSPLSPAAVGVLAEPAGVDPAELVRVTGGNPFLVVESIAASGKLPESVRDATLARVTRLGSSARRAVEAAAVVGQRMAPSVLSAVVPGSESAVEEALDRGVLTDDGTALGFRHELIRQAVEGTVSATRRAELHGRAFAALVERGDDDVARLAHHADRAGLASEATRYALLAAAEAERVGALTEATLQLERALRVGGGLSADDRFEVLLRYARAANFASRMQDSLRGAEEAVALAQEMGDARNRGRALVVHAMALWSLDRMAEAAQAAGRAVEELEHSGDAAELARAHAGHIRMQATAFDSAAAIDAAPRALELAARSNLEEVRVDVMISLGLARGHRGEPDAGEVLAAALAAAQAAGLHIQTIRAYVNAIAVAADARDHATVDAVSGPALALFDEHETAAPRDAVLIQVGRSLLDRGRWEDARARAALGRRTWHGEVPLASVVDGLLQARRGDPGAQALLERALTDVAGVPPGWRHGVIRTALAEEAWLRGDRPAVQAQALAGRSAPYADHFARSAGELALWATRCGDPVDAPARAPEPVLCELAGDWRGAIRGWRELDAPYEAALAALPGDERAAREAMGALQRLGASAAARAFARERVESGARAPRGPRRSTLGNAAGLTRREREVLTHLSRGATNAGIADALHLSERTVAHHVSAILGKLGAPTRTAAVEAARSAGLLAQDGPAPGPT